MLLRKALKVARLAVLNSSPGRPIYLDALPELVCLKSFLTTSIAGVGSGSSRAVVRSYLGSVTVSTVEWLLMSVEKCSFQRSRIFDFTRCHAYNVAFSRHYYHASV